MRATQQSYGRPRGTTPGGMVGGPPFSLAPSSVVAIVASPNPPSESAANRLSLVFGGAAPWIAAKQSSPFAASGQDFGQQKGSSVPWVPMGVAAMAAGHKPSDRAMAAPRQARRGSLSVWSEMSETTTQEGRQLLGRATNQVGKRLLKTPWTSESADSVYRGSTPSSEENVITIPDLDLELPLPDWFKEAEADLEQCVPDWPADVLELVRAAPRMPVGAGPAATDEDSVCRGAARRSSAALLPIAVRPAFSETPFWLRKSPESRRARLRLAATIQAVLFATSVERSAMRALAEWAAQMSAQFEGAYQLQMRSCIGWLSRVLRIFCRTLVTDSHAGLDLAPDSRQRSSRPWRALSAPKRLEIRVGVLLDLLQSETPPDTLCRFLKRLSSTGSMPVYLPAGYLTPGESVQLQPDARGGVEAPPASHKHEILVIGFVMLRGLLSNLLSSWARSLAADGAQRAQQNLQAVGAALYAGMQHRYASAADAVEVPGLIAAVGEPLHGAASVQALSGPAMAGAGGSSGSPAAAAAYGLDVALVLGVSDRLPALARHLAGVEPDVASGLEDATSCAERAAASEEVASVADMQEISADVDAAPQHEALPHIDEEVHSGPPVSADDALAETSSSSPPQSSSLPVPPPPPPQLARPGVVEAWP